MKWISLDIDGTITNKMHYIPEKVTNCLHALYKDNWKIIISTGRPYFLAKKALASFLFPYIFSSKNGASVRQMPNEKEIFTNHMNENIYNKIKTYSKDLNMLIMVYDTNDCFLEDPLNYSQYIKKFEEIIDHKVTHINKKKHDRYPLIKCIGKKEDILLLKKRISSLDLSVSVIEDKFIGGLYLLLITQKDVSKGSAIKKIIGKNHFLIAAGNDDNDLSMFEIANVNIVMEDAPKHVLEKATIKAAPASKEGIVEALEKAIALYLG